MAVSVKYNTAKKKKKTELKYCKIFISKYHQWGWGYLWIFYDPFPRSFIQAEPLTVKKRKWFVSIR